MIKEATARNAMKLALVRLQARTDTSDLDAIGALIEALAEQEQELVVFCMHWEDRWGCNHYADPKEPHPINAKPLYTSPPAQRKPLTIKQEQKAFEKWWVKEIGDKDDLCSSNVPKFTPTFYAITRVEYAWQAWQARAIEAAHGIKENT